ncbi:YuiB family protein [Solibacillus sp. R5-41]|uniref:YuiB family protein n=1 Tax=Solibacillus sp. R5-41 TaxID=2048654 RepID=UPI0015620621|nr:YuiB family protein [Solibacillus sp. R5-41]
MMNDVSLVQVIISVVLFFVMFFGIGFLLNMLLRMTWLMAIVYPVVVVFIIDEVSFLDYIFKPGSAFPELMDRFQALHLVDIVILSGGFGGAVVAGFVMIALRKAGYRMF